MLNFERYLYERYQNIVAYSIFRRVRQIWKLLLEPEVDAVPLRVVAVDDEVGRLVHDQEVVTAMDHGQVLHGGGESRQSRIDFTKDITIHNSDRS